MNKILKNESGIALLMVLMSVAVLATLLADLTFVRVHSKHLINLEFVKKYVSGRGGYIIFDDGSQVDVSERKKKEFILRMKGQARTT